MVREYFAYRFVRQRIWSANISLTDLFDSEYGPRIFRLQICSTAHMVREYFAYRFVRQRIWFESHNTKSPRNLFETIYKISWLL